MQVNSFGFKKVYGIDLGTSILLYQNNSRDYAPSSCYNNAFACLGNNIKTYKTNKAIIGYVLSTNGIIKVAVRHAWNEISGIKVDVTMIANDENPMSILQYSYLPIRVMTSEEFLNAIEANNNLPCLPITKEERNYRKLLKHKGFQILE